MYCQQSVQKVQFRIEATRAHNVRPYNLAILRLYA